MIVKEIIHLLPKKGFMIPDKHRSTDLYQKWISSIRTDIENLKHVFVCEDHFDPSMIIKETTYQVGDETIKVCIYISIIIY